MTTRDVHGGRQLTGEVSTTSDGQVAAAVVGSLLGGLVGGGALYALATNHILLLALPLGYQSTTIGFGAWLGLAVVLGLGFVAIAGPAVNAYTNAVIALTSRSEPVRRIVQPLVERSALGTTASGIGLVYGLIAGVIIGLVAVPAVVGATTVFDPAVPSTNFAILLGYVLFGYVMGLGYGLSLEGTIPVPTLAAVEPEKRALVVAPLLAAALSAGLMYAGQPLYFSYFAVLIGVNGFIVWFVLSIVLGLAFAYTLGRPAEQGQSTTGYGFLYGILLAVLLGVIGVPFLFDTYTPFGYEYPSSNATELASYILFGIVLGSAYGKTMNDRPLRPAFLVGRTRAVVLSALVAGVVSGAVLYYGAFLQLWFLALSTGAGNTVTAGFGVWMILALVLGLVFATIPARRIDRQERRRAAGLRVGTGFGVIIAIVLGMFVMPAVFSAGTQWDLAVPNTNPVVIGAYVLYGVTFGAVYGTIRSVSTTDRGTMAGRGVPVLGGVLVGAAISAIVVYAASPGYFIMLGAIVGVSSILGGVAIWSAMALVFGLLFVPLGARSVEVDVGPLRGFGVGTFYGVVLAATVGLYGAPMAINSQTLWGPLATPHLAVPVVGYLLFGAVFGTVFGHLRTATLEEDEVPTATPLGTPSQRAVLFGSLFGGFLGGLVVHHGVGLLAMLYLGSIVGYVTGPAGWGVWLGLALVLGIVYGGAVGPRLEGYAESLGELAARDPDVDAILGPALEDAPLTTAATVIGLVYGIVAAVLVGSIGIPMLVNTLTPNGLPMPLFNWMFMFAFVVYGIALGLGYGVTREF